MRATDKDWTHDLIRPCSHTYPHVILVRRQPHVRLGYVLIDRGGQYAPSIFERARPDGSFSYRVSEEGDLDAAAA